MRAAYFLCKMDGFDLLSCPVTNKENQLNACGNSNLCCTFFLRLGRTQNVLLFYDFIFISNRACTFQVSILRILHLQT